MVEAPEAMLLCEQLSEAIVGRTVTEVVAGFTPHKFAWYHGDPARYEHMLKGQRVEGARARGGMIELTIGPHILLLSEGVNITFIPAGTKLPPKHQLLLGFDDESCITVSVRMYGGMPCFENGRIEGSLTPYYMAALEKPQVMADDFTFEYFSTLMDPAALGKMSVKAALATEQAIPGLGNGVLQDILYNARIHPKYPAAELSPEQRQNLYDSIRTTLSQIYAAGGRDSESDIYGHKGGYHPWLSKDTVGHSCTKCSSTIQKQSYMGGSIYFCPGCQKL